MPILCTCKVSTYAFVSPIRFLTPLSSVAPDAAYSIHRQLAASSPPAHRILYNAYHVIVGVTPGAIQSIHGTSIDGRSRSNSPAARGLPATYLLASSIVEV
jgi:hypothetical protein